MFFLDLLPPSVPCCRSAKFYLNMPGDLGHVIILTSSIQLIAYSRGQDVIPWDLLAEIDFFVLSYSLTLS